MKRYELKKGEEKRPFNLLKKHSEFDPQHFPR